jgi:hypothetical protein
MGILDATDHCPVCIPKRGLAYPSTAVSMVLIDDPDRTSIKRLF